MLPDKFRECRVHWIDSSCLQGWNSRDELESYCQEPPSKIETLGWLVYEAADYVVVAQSASEKTVDNVLKIPRFAITDMFVMAPDDR